MRMKKTSLLLIIFVGFVVFIIAKNVFTDDEAEIAALLDSLESYAEFQERLKPLEIASRVGAVQKLVNQNIAADVTDYNGKLHKFDGWNTIKNGMLIGSRLITSSNITRYATTIKVVSRRADAKTRYEIVGSDDLGNQFKEEFNAHFILEKIDGEWKLIAVQAERL